MRKRHTGDYVFAATLTISLLLHLSAITLFRIVIYFPRHDIEYFDVSIVDPTRAAPSQTPFVRERLSLNTPGSGFDRIKLESDSLVDEDSWGSLPDIRLPTLRFDQLGRLRIQRLALKTRLRYDDLFDEAPEDAWSRFGRKLSSVSESLSRIAHGSAPAEATRPVPVSRPAPGYAAYLEWLSEPLDRQPLSVHPIEALWGLNPADFGEPITMVFLVDRDGRVVDILFPVESTDGLLQASMDALMRYRFEPLLGDGPSTQHGTMIVRASGENA